MANEAKVFQGTQKTLEANGASAANNTIVQANDASYGIVADGGGYPDALFALGVTFGTAPTEGSLIVLIARVLNIDGTNDAEVPEATRLDRYLGNFTVNNVTTLQYMELFVRNVPREADYYLYNNSTGQTMSAGWTLKVTPITIGPA